MSGLTVSGAWHRVSAGESPEGRNRHDPVLTTILVCDLVESTSLFEHLGDERAAGILRRHDRNARDLIAVHGGREIDKTDGFLLLFDRPIAAVIYAQVYHQMIETLSREEDVELAARVGIHVGEVILYENSLADVARGAKPLEVEGLAKPMASRLMSLAMGRQTLVSRSVYEMTRRRLSAMEDATGSLLFMSHGDYWFKGVDHPIEVIEIGRSGFSPLKAPEGSDKARQSSFAAEPEGPSRETEGRPRRTGRRMAWAAVLAAALALGLVLALRFAGLFGELPRERPTISVVGFKNSSGQTDLGWISTAFSEMLRTELAAGDRLQVVPGESVARMKIELELPEVDALAPETLARVGRNLGTDYVVLGTYLIHGEGSNRPLRLDLRLQETDTGRTLASDFVMGREDELFEMVAKAGDYLRRKLGLDAISIAEADAVRASVSASPEATRFYAEGLEQMRRYNALAAQELLAKAVEADPGYSLAHAALSEAWSELGHDPMALESARRALELARDLPREAVLLIYGRYYEVSGEWDDAIETYQDLWRSYPDNVEHGLLLAEAERQAGDGDAALTTVEELRKLPAPSRDDPRIDLAEAYAGHILSDFQRELEAGRRAEEKGRHRNAKTLVAEALWRQGTALNILGEFEDAAKALKASQQLFTEVGDLGRTGRVMNIYGLQLEEEGHFSRAEDVLEQALSIHRRTGNRKYISTELYNVGDLKKQRGELATARGLLDEALSLAREIGDKRRESFRQIVMSAILLEQGSLEEAERWLQDALETAKELDNDYVDADAYRQLGQYSFVAGNLEDAERSFRDALELYGKLGVRHLTWQTANDLGELLLARDELDAARKELARAESIRSDIGGPLARIRMNQAALLLEEGSYAEAESFAKGAVGELEREARRDEAILATGLLVEALVKQGRTDEARDAADSYRVRANESQSPRVRLSFTIAAATAGAAAGAPRDAAAELAAARDEAAKLGMAGLAFEARLALGEVELASGEKGAGQRLRSLAAEAEENGFALLGRKATESAARAR